MSQEADGIRQDERSRWNSRHMFGPTVTDPALGLIRRRWGKWRGVASLPSQSRDLELVIEIPRHESVDSYLRRASNVVTKFNDFQNDLIETLFEDYNFYKRMDIDEGGFTEDDFKAYPAVNRPRDVWDVLQPYCFWIGHPIDKYHGNAYMLMDVNWPNPHFFQVFLQLDADSWQHMHTEFVG